MYNNTDYNKSSKTYVIICGFADVVAGGPIYYANKIKYMESLGWNVVVIPTNKGEKVYIQNMKRFWGPYVPFILDTPNEYNKHQREKLIDYLECFIPQNSGYTIIETGTDYTNYWGEVLAQRIHARHIVIFLDEDTPRINNKNIGFYKFKYSRHEMACINQLMMQKFFHGYLDLGINNCYGLPCCCSNSIEDYDCPLIKNIPNGDFKIGYIGRLEKDIVDIIIGEFIKFANAHHEETIAITFFGGAFESKTIDNLNKTFSSVSNVKIHITGYLYPLPYHMLKKMDLFVSGAGSATTAFKAGAISIKVSCISKSVLGIVSDCDNRHFIKCPYGDSVKDYLEWILVKRAKIPIPQASFKNDWEAICHKFDKHIDFIKSANPTLNYYDVRRLGLSTNKKIKKILRTVFGLKFYNAIYNSNLHIKLWRLTHK